MLEYKHLDAEKNAYVVKSEVDYNLLSEPKIYTIGNYNLDTFEKNKTSKFHILYQIS